MLFAQPQFAVRKSLQVSRTISSGAILDWGVRKMKAIIQLRAAARALSITSFHLFLIFFLCLALPALAAAQDPWLLSYLPAIDTNSGDYPSNIWMTDTMQKVRQETGSPGTVHWGTFYGTQNEFVDFQVHVQAPAGGYSALNVTVSNFVQTAPHSYTISAATTLPPSIVVYREAYMDVTIKSAANGSYYDATGWYPDILIPKVDPYWGQTTNAFPYPVTAGYNQSVWVDVQIPPAAPAGYYLGSVTVSNGGTTLATMPVIIGVWQWPSAQGGQMPSTTTLAMEESGFSYGAICTQMYNPNTSSLPAALSGTYPGAGGTSVDGCTTQVWIDEDQILKDHRFSSGGGENIQPGSGSFSSYVTQVGPILNGTCNLHNGAGTTCPLLAGSKAPTKQIYPANAAAAAFLNWQANFTAQGWGTNGNLPLYNYLVDEPSGTGAYGTAVAKSVAQHAYFTSTTPIPELVTTDIWYGQHSQSAADTFATTACGSPQCINNAVDIMVTLETVLEYPGNPTPLQPLSTYQAWLAGNTNGVKRHWWSYQDCEEGGSCANGHTGPSNFPNYPNRHVDGRPAANRAQEWITFLHGQTGELYYDADFCDYPVYGNQCSNGAATYDPWKSIYYSGAWGDGTIVYAGGVKSGQDNYMGPGVTIPLILPSVRLKHARDGVQDYEYLNALTVAGKGAFVQSQIASWATNTYTFEETGTGLQAARSNLGTALHQLTYSPVLMPPPNLTGILQ